MFMRIAVPEFGALSMAAGRIALAALAMLVLMLVLGEHLPWRRDGLTYVLIGGVNTALPFVAYSFAAQHIPAGYSAIANATTPIWSALIAWLWFRQALGRSVWLGILLAFLGVYVLVGLQAIEVTTYTVLGLAAALSGAALYALAGYLINHHLAAGNGLVGATGMVLGAAVWLVLPGYAAAPSVMPSWQAWLALFALALLCTALGYVLFFGLIRDFGPQRASSVAFLFPAFAAFWGWLFLDEPIRLNMLLGMGMVFLGTLLVTGAWRGLGASLWGLWERLLLPLLFVLSPTALKRRILEHVQTQSGYFTAAADCAAQTAARVLPGVDPNVVTREQRLTRFIDAVDPLRSALCERSTLKHHVRIEPSSAPLPTSGPCLILGAHHGSGWWALPWLRRLRHDANVRIVAAGLPDTKVTTFNAFLQMRYARWRWRELNRIGGQPVILMRQALVEARQHWLRGGAVIALLDIPSVVARKTHPAPFLERIAWLPRALIDAAVAAQVPIYHLHGHFDVVSLSYRLKFEPYAEPSDAERAFAEYASRLEAEVRLDPGRWHLWGDYELLFESPRSARQRQNQPERAAVT